MLSVGFLLLCKLVLSLPYGRSVNNNGSEHCWFFRENYFLSIIDDDSNGVVEAVGVRGKPPQPYICV